MKRIVERHLARRLRARHPPSALDDLGALCFDRLYPGLAARLTRTRQERIPADAPDWLFEAELRRSGLWAMMERCYPSPEAQSQ
jgi:hypothetical protein